MNSYQKLKQRVAELESELHTVCTKPKSLKALEIVGRINILSGWADIITMGSRNNIGNGLIDQIEKVK